jgi:hypothetical protein
MAIYVDNGRMVSCCCTKCGIEFAFTKDNYTHYLNNGKEFFCPNKHANHFAEPNQKNTSLSDAEEKIKELEAELKGYQDNPGLSIVIGNKSEKENNKT